MIMQVTTKRKSICQNICIMYTLRVRMEYISLHSHV